MLNADALLTFCLPEERCIVQCPSTRSYLPLLQFADRPQSAHAFVQHFPKLWLTYTVATKSFLLWLFAFNCDEPITERCKIIRAATVALANLKHDKLSNEGASHQRSTAEAAVHEEGYPKPLQATVWTV